MPQAECLSESPTIPPDQPYLDAEPSHRDRLKREAEGLFAGVTLLNEMEPLEDTDEPDVAQSHKEVHLKITQVLEDFLYQLQPTGSGKSIECSSCSPWTLDYKDTFQCTSRDIQNHFRQCGFLLDGQLPAEVFDDEALEAFLELPESKTHIANLQHRCRKIQGGLYSLLDIDDFLYQLEFLPSGKVKCQRLACAKLDRFEPDSSSIRTHFLLYHCHNFQGALRDETTSEIDKRIKSYLRRPKTASIMAKIRENAQIGIPLAQRISEFTRLRVKLLSEVESSITAHISEIEKPSWEQLRVLRTMRAKFIVNHRQFLQRTANSCSDKLQELRRSCRHYENLPDTGLLTFKAIMNDESPSSLKEIFAFISLSHAMVGTMQAEGKPVNFCLNKDEMRRWRRSLRKRTDRRTFDILVPLLWPELNTYREENPGNPISSFQSTRLAMLSERGSPLLRPTAERLLEESSSDGSFSLSDWLNFSNTDDLPSQPRKFNLVASLHDTSWTRPPDIQPQSDLRSRGGNTSSPSEMQDTQSDGEKSTLEQLQCLAQTVIFMQAISFLICKTC